MPIVSVAVAYDGTDSYQNYICIFNQVLFIEQLAHSLICPNQQ
jgi:hypothetical protein